MAGRIALAAGLLLVWGSVAGADPAPIVVFHAPNDAADARAALAGVASRNGTALIDLSPAPDPAPRAGQLLTRGIDAYQALKYDAALAHIDEGLAEAARTGANGLSGTDLSDLLLYRALVVTEQGNATAAWDDFVRAAVVDPTRKLDPVRFPPRISETFQRAVDAVQNGKKSEITIEAPTECAARFDGRAVEPRVPVPAAWGEHYVRVECAGARPYGARVIVSEVSQVVRPSLAAPKAATEADVAALAKRRGAVWALFAAVIASPDAAPTLRLQLLEAATGKRGNSAVVALDGDVAAAAQRLIDGVVHPTPPIVVTPVDERHWYQKPWVWGIAGAAVATAALLPFVFDSQPADKWDAELVFP